MKFTIATLTTVFAMLSTALATPLDGNDAVNEKRDSFRDKGASLYYNSDAKLVSCGNGGLEKSSVDGQKFHMYCPDGDDDGMYDLATNNGDPNQGGTIFKAGGDGTPVLICPPTTTNKELRCTPV